MKNVLHSLPVLLAAACDPFPTGGAEIDTLNRSNLIKSVECETTDPNGDGAINPDEVIEPVPSVVLKPTCFGDIQIRYETCLWDDMDGQEPGVAYTLDDVAICSTWELLLTCEGGEPVVGSPTCLEGYCTTSIESDGTPMACGWRLMSFEARRAGTEELLERFTPDLVEGLGFELLPVAARE